MGIDVQIAYITNGYGKVQHLEEIDADMGDKKMRLIDADRVMQSIDMQMIIARELLNNKPQSQEFVSIAEQSFKQEISNAPTVNAIPVEWIDGYIKRRVNDAEIYAEILFISDMVTEWEKENAEVSD